MELKVYRSDSAEAALVLAHGAGAGQDSPFMVRAAEGLARRGVVAATFEFPYMAAGRKVPDRPAVLEQAWRDAIESARLAVPGLPLFMGGKSMGGRIASHVAAQGLTAVKGLIFLGYPLHPPGRPDQRRDAHLPQVRLPMLFVQGTRDAFGTAGEIRALLPQLPEATLHEVAGGDHSFKVAGRAGQSAAAVQEHILDVAARWLLDRVRLV